MKYYARDTKGIFLSFKIDQRKFRWSAAFFQKSLRLKKCCALSLKFLTDTFCMKMIDRHPRCLQLDRPMATSQVSPSIAYL